MWIRTICALRKCWHATICCLDTILSGTYVLVITSRKEAGNFLGFPVYQVNSMKFLYCNEALQLSTSQEVVLLLLFACISFFFFFFHITIKRWMLPAYSDSPLNAEKGWVLLHDSVEDSRINSRIVLFLQNRYNTEVSLWTPNFCVSYAHALILYIVLLRFLPFNNYWPCSSLQRRYKLTDGWMNKPIWKQVR